MGTVIDTTMFPPARPGQGPKDQVVGKNVFSRDLLKVVGQSLVVEVDLPQPIGYAVSCDESGKFSYTECTKVKAFYKPVVDRNALGGTLGPSSLKIDLELISAYPVPTTGPVVSRPESLTAENLLGRARQVSAATAASIWGVTNPVAQAFALRNQSALNWEFQSTDEDWHSCSTEDAQQLEEAFASRPDTQAEFTLGTWNFRYTIDFERMLQTNCVTGKTRALRRCSVTSASSKMNPSPSRWDIDGVGAASSNDHVKMDTAQAMQSCSEPIEMVLGPHDWTYVVDFKNMTQTNARNGTKRKLRLVETQPQ